MASGNKLFDASVPYYAPQAVDRNMLLSGPQTFAPAAPPSTYDKVKSYLYNRFVAPVVGAVTLPGDVYAGRVDPMSDEGIGRANDLAGLAMTGGMPMAEPGAAGIFGGRLAAASGPGIRAFHGSPHDFDAFDLSKIGTGEGAQAYGHGLYFAENPEVAKGYRDALTPGAGTQPVDIAARLLKGVDGDQQAALAEMGRRIDSAWANGSDYADIQRLMQAKNIINTEPHKAAGRMYEVGINADPSHFLDWENMTPDMQAKVKTPQGAQELAQQGVPGVKYLDQGSRAAGDGSRNYVVFDDKLVSILRKYGWVPGAAIPAAAMLEYHQQGGSEPQT